MALCPVCKEAVITLRAYEDGDGDGVYARSWTAVEIDEQECDCQLTDEQIDKLCAEWEPDDEP